MHAERSSHPPRHPPRGGCSAFFRAQDSPIESQAANFGQVNTKVEPSPSSDSTRISPPRFSTIFLTSDRPIPVPSTESLSLIHISEPTRRTPISYAVFCLNKKT